jgi:DNA-directed RNA polymerase subunit RPC12/RpoP
MKKMKKSQINQYVENYFDCPYCQARITDNGGNYFEVNDVIVCDNCNKQIKLED